MLQKELKKSNYAWIIVMTRIQFQEQTWIKKISLELTPDKESTHTRTCDSMSKGAKSDTYHTNLFITYYIYILSGFNVAS